MSDIEYDAKPLKTILDNMLDKHELTMDEFNSVLNADFMVHWFLDAHYSDEFEEFLDTLNEEIKSGRQVDFDSVVEKNTDTVFYQDEKNIWSSRLLNCAYLKLITGSVREAEILYNIYYDNTYKEFFFKFVMRKSLYEYYFTMLYNNDTSIFTQGQLTDIVSEIESKWVK